jgi:hypothetical protein
VYPEEIDGLMEAVKTGRHHTLSIETEKVNVLSLFTLVLNAAIGTERSRPQNGTGPIL